MAKVQGDCILEPVPPNKTPADFVPQNSSKRPVSRGESFTSIARALEIDPWALIAFNFPHVGKAPSKQAARQVNWYLQEYLGCTQVTFDQKNYVFHEGMKRPFIYVPHSIADFDSGTEFTVTLPTDVWFGFGWKMSQAMGGLIQTEVKEEHIGGLLSYDHYEDWFSCSIRGTRYGLHVSLIPSGHSLVAYVATGLKEPGLLNDHEIKGFDFSLQLGPLSKGLRAASTAWKLGKAGTAAVKLGLTFAEWEKTREIFKQIITNLDIDMKSATPKLHVIDLPLSIGVDASIYYLKAKLKVDLVNVKVGRQVTITENASP